MEITKVNPPIPAKIPVQQVPYGRVFFHGSKLWIRMHKQSEDDISCRNLADGSARCFHARMNVQVVKLTKVAYEPV